jgi:hypothetical protein
MASSGDIAAVRKNVNEPTPTTWADADINALVDELGVAGASATIWDQKASSYAELVDVSEAGASRKNSDLMKNASARADFYRGQITEGGGGEVSADRRIRVRKIVRS